MYSYLQFCLDSMEQERFVCIQNLVLNMKDLFGVCVTFNPFNVTILLKILSPIQSQTKWSLSRMLKTFHFNDKGIKNTYILTFLKDLFMTHYYVQSKLITVRISNVNIYYNVSKL